MGPEILDLTDRRILAELDKNSRIPISMLAKRVKKSREVVKYRIQQLVKRGVITGFMTSINPNKLGYYMFKVYLQLENTPEREKFYEYLKGQKSVYWIGLSDGAFDCVFAILSRSITDYYKQINDIMSRFEKLVVRKVLGTMVDTMQYNKKFFTDDKEGSFVVFAGDVADNRIDKTDQRMLEMLANNARMPVTELAQKTGSTPDIVRGRIKRMEKQGIILGYRIAVDLNKLGYEFFKAFVYFKSLSSKDERMLLEWMRCHPKSVYYIRSLAPWDAEFEFVVESYVEFNGIINELRQKFPDVVSHCEHLIMIQESWMPAWMAV
jgi:Lrp/AsnC family leucine-responsive transcriptional regulator